MTAGQTSIPVTEQKIQDSRFRFCPANFFNFKAHLKTTCEATEIAFFL